MSQFSARISRGIDSEQRLVTILKDYGCKIMTDVLIDHEQKLDFIVLSIPDFPRLLSKKLGVQVTNRIGDGEKRREFFRRCIKTPYVEKHLYLESDPDLDLEKGGAFAILNAIAAFLIDQRFKDWIVGSVHVEKDLAYYFSGETPHGESQGTDIAAAHPEQFTPPAIPDRLPLSTARALVPSPSSPQAFSPRPAVTRPDSSTRLQTALLTAGILQKPCASAPFAETLRNALGKVELILTGKIIFFDGTSGMGKIETDDKRQEFFLHRKNISDRKLLEEIDAACRIRSRVTGIHFPTAVKFKDGGKPKGKQNNIAQDVRKADDRAATA